MNIISRTENIKTFITREELRTMESIDMQQIPDEILNYTGRGITLSYPQQGMCSIVGILKSQNKDYVIKIARGDYRGKELYAEYLAMKGLHNTAIPVPDVFMFHRKGDIFYLLRECSNGTPLNTLFNDNEDMEQRRVMIGEMAACLSKIHCQKFDGYTWDNFINAQLYFAEQHLNNNTIDLSEFVFNGKETDPGELLEWLRDNKPEPGRVCLLHGDYRPKNFLWNGSKISSILDWAFCDIGDPYYDFAIFMYYLKDEKEKQHFLKCYGLNELDEARLRYFEYMAVFINI